MINERCWKESLKLTDTNVILNDLSKWKLYQLHKAIKKKSNKFKKQIRNDICDESMSDCKTDLCVCSCRVLHSCQQFLDLNEIWFSESCSRESSKRWKVIMMNINCDLLWIAIDSNALSSFDYLSDYLVIAHCSWVVIDQKSNLVLHDLHTSLHISLHMN